MSNPTLLGISYPRTIYNLFQPNKRYGPTVFNLTQYLLDAKPIKI